MADQETTLTPGAETTPTTQAQGTGDNSQTGDEAKNESGSTQDITKLRDEILQQVRDEIAKTAEGDRRRVQSEADRKIQALTAQYEKRLQASQQALRETLAENLDADSVGKIQSQVALREQAGYAGMMQAEQRQQQEAQYWENKALQAAKKAGLSREDFKESEWGGNYDVWVETVLLPKQEARLRKKLKGEIAQTLKDETEAETRAVEQKAETGATATEAGGTGSASGSDSEFQQKIKKLRGTGRVGEAFALIREQEAKRRR